MKAPPTLSHLQHAHSLPEMADVWAKIGCQLCPFAGHYQLGFKSWQLLVPLKFSINILLSWLLLHWAAKMLWHCGGVQGGGGSSSSSRRLPPCCHRLSLIYITAPLLFDGWRVSEGGSRESKIRRGSHHDSPLPESSSSSYAASSSSSSSSSSM